MFIALNKFQENELSWNLMYLIAFIILGDGIYKFSKKITTYKRTAYLVTNLRVFIKKGRTQESVTSFERSKIVFLDLKASKTEQKFNVGTILIHLGEIKDYDGVKEKIFYKLESVRDPNAILRLF